MKQLVFELINPSDKIIFKAKSLEVAAFSTLLLGNGRYSADEVAGDLKVPMFFFGGAVEWYLETFKRDIEATEFDLDFRDDVAECMASFEVVGERSSMNDICSLAKRWSDKFKKEAEALRKK